MRRRAPISARTPASRSSWQAPAAAKPVSATLAAAGMAASTRACQIPLRWWRGESAGTSRGSAARAPTGPPSSPIPKALTRILRGIGALSSGELAGERIAAALESHDQEDEHSCFSDNTNADVVNDIKASAWSTAAQFARISGPGVDDLVAEVDAGLAADLRRQIDATLATAQALPATFETMIAARSGSPEHQAISAVVVALEAQGADLAKAAKALGVKVNLEV